MEVSRRFIAFPSCQLPTANAHSSLPFPTQVIWPSAKRSWDLLNGAKIHVESGLLNYYTAGPSAGLANGRPDSRTKRTADDAFSRENTNILQQDAYNELTKRSPHVAMPASHEPTTTHTVLAQMLGIALPGVEPSTSYLPGYAWWPRQGQGEGSGVNGTGSGNGSINNNNDNAHTHPNLNGTIDLSTSNQGSIAHSTPSLPVSSPSPHSSIDTSSPASAGMPIPFTFDQTGYWMGPMMSAPDTAFGMDFAS